jgi:hypothetical protein
MESGGRKERGGGGNRDSVNGQEELRKDERHDGALGTTDLVSIEIWVKDKSTSVRVLGLSNGVWRLRNDEQRPGGKWGTLEL